MRGLNINPLGKFCLETWRVNNKLPPVSMLLDKVTLAAIFA
jgi:hypothetical protein